MNNKLRYHSAHIIKAYWEESKATKKKTLRMFCNLSKNTSMSGLHANEKRNMFSSPENFSSLQ